MNPHLSLQFGRRFGAALALLLVLCAVLTTVSVLQARQLAAADAGVAAAATADPLAPLRQTLRQLDLVRGLEAQHLLLATASRKRAVETELTAQRRMIGALLALCPPLPGDSTDGQFAAQVRADLAAYWAVQEQLLAASRAMLADPAAAGQAQQLLGGASQTQFDRLRERLDAWWTHRESRAQEAAAARNAQAATVLWAIALLGALAFAAGLALVSIARSRAAPGVADPAALDSTAPAPAHRVQALQSLIDAGRTGATAPAVREVGTAAAGD